MNELVQRVRAEQHPSENTVKLIISHKSDQRETFKPPVVFVGAAELQIRRFEHEAL